MITGARLSMDATTYARMLVLLFGIVAAGLLRPVNVSAQYRSLFKQTVINLNTPGVSAPFNPTALALAPDGRLFVAVLDGRIYAVTLNSELQATGVELINTIHAIGNGLPPNTPGYRPGRTVTGIAFHPANGDLYVSHSDGRLNDAGIQQGSGHVTRLTAASGYSVPQDVATGLPRSRRDHGPNGMAFKFSNGAWYLYLAQAGMTNAGRLGPAPAQFMSTPDTGDDDWTLEETYHSGAILRMDPEWPDSHVLYATGLRNPYKPLWHSNGQMYSNDNGPNVGAGAAPKPDDCSADGSTPVGGDELNRITEGAFYGHPNPASGRNECVYNGAGHTPPIVNYGLHTSANGLAEYYSDAIPGLYQHIFTAHYTTGLVNSVRISGIDAAGLGPAIGGFGNPLDVAISPAGNIFVAEFKGYVAIAPNVTPDSGLVSVLRPRRAMAVDFDADRRSDLTIFRPSTNTWHTWTPKTGGLLQGVVTLGSNGDLLRPADFDGDGKVDHVSWNPSTYVWTLPRSSCVGLVTDCTVTVAHGSPGDIPLSADIDGDARADQIIFRPATGVWHVRYANTGIIIPYQHGQNCVPSQQNCDIPRVMDVDADGRPDLTVFRRSAPSGWYILPHGSPGSIPYSGSVIFKQFGEPDDIPVPADYDGDGRTDIALWRPSTGYWHIRTAASNFNTVTSHQWGLNGDSPRPLDYDGDGKADLVVWRPSTGVWWILLSATPSHVSIPHGGPGDIAVDSVF